MKLSNAILVSVQKSPGKVTRTVLQKVLYLAALRGIVDTDFEPHYYGPYSQEVASTIEDLTSAGLLNEISDVFGPGEGPWEIRRYRYSLQDEVEHALDAAMTDQEREEAEELWEIIESCERRGALNPRALSIATKTLFVLDETRKELTEAQIAKRAKEIGWDVEESEVKQSIDLLADLGLVEP